MSHIEKISVDSTADFAQPRDFLALGIFQEQGPQPADQGVDDALGGLIAQVWERKNFRGKQGESLVLYGRGPLARVALIGLGEADKFTADRARQAAGNAVQAARSQKATACELLVFESELPPAELTQALAEGLILASYRFDAHKQPDKDAVQLDRLSLVGAVDVDGLERGSIMANAVCFTRELQNEPANVMTKEPSTSCSVCCCAQVQPDIWPYDASRRKTRARKPLASMGSHP